MGQEFKTQDIFSIYMKKKKMFVLFFLFFFCVIFFALYLTKKPIWKIRSSYIISEVDSVESTIDHFKYNVWKQHSEKNIKKIKEVLESYLENNDPLVFLSKNIKLAFTKKKEPYLIKIGFQAKNESKDILEKLLNVFEKYILYPKVRIVYRNQILKKRTTELITEKFLIPKLIKKNQENIKLAMSEIKFLKDIVLKKKKYGMLTKQLVDENVFRFEIQIRRYNEENKLLKIKGNELMTQIEEIESLRKMDQIPINSTSSIINAEQRRVRLISGNRVQQVFKSIMQKNTNYGFLKKTIVASLLSFLLASMCVFFTYKRE